VAALSVARGASRCDSIAEFTKLVVGAALAKVNDPISGWLLIKAPPFCGVFVSVDWHAMDKRRSLLHIAHAPGRTTKLWHR